MPDNINEQTSEQEIISTESSFISTAGLDQNLVNLLVANFQSANRKIPAQELQEMLQGRDLAKRDLVLYTSWLADAHSFFRDASHGELTLSFASEWVLDNYYIVRQALEQIKEDLPASFYNQLPKLTSGSFKGLPRIYGIARTILHLATVFAKFDRSGDHSDSSAGANPADDGGIVGPADLSAIYQYRGVGT